MVKSVGYIAGTYRSIIAYLSTVFQEIITIFITGMSDFLNKGILGYLPSIQELAKEGKFPDIHEVLSDISQLPCEKIHKIEDVFRRGMSSMYQARIFHIVNRGMFVVLFVLCPLSLFLRHRIEKLPDNNDLILVAVVAFIALIYVVSNWIFNNLVFSSVSYFKKMKLSALRIKEKKERNKGKSNDKK